MKGKMESQKRRMKEGRKGEDTERRWEREKVGLHKTIKGGGKELKKDRAEGGFSEGE